MIVGVFIQTIVVIVPVFADAFKLVPLNLVQWIVTLIISVLPIPIMELQKIADRKKLGKVIYMNKNYAN